MMVDGGVLLCGRIVGVGCPGRGNLTELERILDIVGVYVAGATMASS